MINVAHLITGLETGGAERMLVQLAGQTDAGRFRSMVISMTGPGTMGSIITDSGVPLHSLDMRRGIANPWALLRLRRLLREFRPAVLQTWLYHADLLGLTAWRLGWAPHLAWCLQGTETVGTGVVRELLRRCSGAPDAVVVVSQVGQRFHEALGYHPRRWAHIPNGFDTDVLLPNPELRRRQRIELGLDDAAVAIAIAARFDPQKDHATFVAAAGLLAARLPEARFVLIGKDSDSGNRALAEMIAANGIGDRVLLLGERPDLYSLYPAFDIVTLSSAYGESFPLALGEAMSCGVPCVATDVGGSADLIGDTGVVVPPHEPMALAAGWQQLAVLAPDERAARGRDARARIVEHFDLAGIVRRYEALYEDIAVR